MSELSVSNGAIGTGRVARERVDGRKHVRSLLDYSEGLKVQSTFRITLIPYSPVIRTNTGVKFDFSPSVALIRMQRDSGPSGLRTVIEHLSCWPKFLSFAAGNNTAQVSINSARIVLTIRPHHYRPNHIFFSYPRITITMQFTKFSLLTAALATLSAAAAVPAVGKQLPAKFTLTMTPNISNTGTVVDKFPSIVTVDEGADVSKYPVPTLLHTNKPQSLTLHFSAAQLGLGGLNHPGLPQIKLTGMSLSHALITHH